MNRMTVLLASYVVAALAADCAISAGREFDASYAQSIEPGKTTREENTKHLGKPLPVTRSNENEIWISQYARGQNAVGSLMMIYGGRPATTEYEIRSIMFDGEYVKDFPYSATQ